MSRSYTLLVVLAALVALVGAQSRPPFPAVNGTSCPVNAFATSTFTPAAPELTDNDFTTFYTTGSSSFTLQVLPSALFEVMWVVPRLPSVKALYQCLVSTPTVNSGWLDCWDSVPFVFFAGVNAYNQQIPITVAFQTRDVGTPVTAAVYEMRAYIYSNFDTLAPSITSLPPDPPPGATCWTFPKATVTDNCETPYPDLGASISQNADFPCRVDVQYYAYDGSYNLGVYGINAGMIDFIPPVITANTDELVSCLSNLLPNANGPLYPATAIDPCNGPVPVTYQDFPTGKGTRRGINRVWTAVDACNNTATFVEQVALYDPGPEILLPPDVVISCQSPTTPSVTGTATAIGCNPTSITGHVDKINYINSCDPTYATILRTWIAVEVAGIKAAATQTITLSYEPPVFVSFPADVTYQCNAVGPTSPAFVGTPTSAPACSGNPNFRQTTTVSYSDFTLAGCGNTYTVRT